MLAPVLCGLLAGTSLLLGGWLPAQTLEPSPIVADTPSPSPEPTATPIPTATPAPTGTSQLTLTPGLPDPSVVAAYNAARTPLVDVTLNPTAATNGGTTSGVVAPTGAGGIVATQTVRQTVQGRSCTQTVLPAPAKSGSKNSRTNSATAGATSQPVAAVVLTYDPSCAGQMVWVQMAGAGTLTADDGAGHTYDGSNGFYLTLDANAMATFNYQAPNRSGTYQVLTRLFNVKTILPFLVADPAP